MSTEETDQVTVRPATHADCEAITAIIKPLYGVLERMPFCFHADVCNDTKFTFVGLISGQIVAYSCGHVIDDGEAIIMREARVSDKCRGRNVIGKLDTAVIKAAWAKFPNLKTMTWASVDGKACDQVLSTHPKMTRFLYMPVETFHTDSAVLKAVCAGELFLSLSKKYKIDTIKGYPKREALKLLTEEICFLDYAPLRPLIDWQPSGWHASTLGNQLQFTELFTSRCPNTDKIQAFSLLTTTMGKYGIRADVALYCDQNAGSEDMTIAHLLHSIREMSIMHSHTRILAIFMCPSIVSKKSVKAVLDTQLGIQTNINDWTENGIEYKIADAFERNSKL